MTFDGDVAPGVAPSRVRSGEWVRVRRGAYTTAAALSEDTYLRERQLVLARAAAAVRQSRGAVVLSHDAAATVWGAPLLALPAATHVAQGTRRAGNAAHDVVRHRRPAAVLDAMELLGLPVTSLARTVVDCACLLGVRAGLVVADAAMASGLDRRASAAIVASDPGARGIRAARAVLAFADDGAESPGESLARWAILRAGFPPPETQLVVDTRLGTFWLDLGWPEWHLGVEFDGMGKYGDAPRAVVLAEKRRHDAITEAGWRLIRLTFADVRSPQALAARLIRALGPQAPSLTPRRDLGS